MEEIDKGYRQMCVRYPYFVAVLLGKAVGQQVFTAYEWSIILQ